MSRTSQAWFFLVIASVTHLTAAERINHEGRVLGPQVVVSSPILFNTAGADNVMSSLQIMPRDSSWNEDISGRPVAGNSTAMITNISNNSHIFGEEAVDLLHQALSSKGSTFSRYECIIDRWRAMRPAQTGRGGLGPPGERMRCKRLCSTSLSARLPAS